MSSSHQQVAYEIDHGSIWVRMNNGRYWKVRRNGATKLWKRDLFRYRIPVKAGLYVFSEITNETEIGAFDSDAMFIASDTDPNTCPYRKLIKQARNHNVTRIVRQCYDNRDMPMPAALQREEDRLNGKFF